ncbi:hypothetical protein NBO_18g0022 [Nosema bombycis CQ1]|uniref:Uncharacterized protein n=1 Tax=Nosema bombycis (strain CQ1 / CVCC 102059) TaxID=578461 RepID=R0MKC5_NOSB1|nr:hypothetical protein NBO_18g0022 [Nosema bombycis CQ1]|eukprot:EOB14695.1 hypothetical protein NBO_18g0022 [Nosema bombycis CQ1]
MAFSIKMQNYNETKISRSQIHKFGCLRKINFYSNLEDNIGRIVKSTYLPEKSLKRAQVNLEGLKFSKFKEINLSKEISKIQNNLDGIKKIGYRLEVTCEGYYLGSAQNILISLCKPENFSFMSFPIFKILYMSNLYTLNSFFTNYSYNDLCKNIVM